MGHLGASVLAGAALLLAATAQPVLAAGTTQRVSVTSAGRQANGQQGSISGDGRLVGFASTASSLVGPVPRGDIFVRDRTLGTTTLVSGRPDGKPSNGTSLLPLVSRDGGCVVFQSYASDLVGGDTNGAGDVFVRDLAAGTTSRVSLGPGGLEANGTSTPKAVSADCRYVAFTSSASNLIAGVTVQGMQLYVRDRQTGATTLKSVGYDGKPGDGPVSFAGISGDGRWLTFATTASQHGPERPQRHLRRLPARPAGGQDGAGQRHAGRRGRQRPQRQPVRLGRRLARRLRVARLEPGRGRHQRARGRVRARPEGRDHDALHARRRAAARRTATRSTCSA